MTCCYLTLISHPEKQRTKQYNIWNVECLHVLCVILPYNHYPIYYADIEQSVRIGYEIYLIPDYFPE